MRSFVCLSTLVLILLSVAQADTTYKFDITYEATHAGQILNQQPCSGWLTLMSDGTYKAKITVDDSGTYRRQNVQGIERVFFTSKTGSQFFGQKQGVSFGIWCYQTPRGTSVWVKGNEAVVANNGKNSAVKDLNKGLSAMAGGSNATFSIKNGRVTKTALFGATSAGNYGYYDRATGELSHDQQGLILRPDGTYYFSSEFGVAEFKERGNYTISANQVLLKFDDGSSFVLTIANNGKQLNYYSQGMLINEYFYLGTVPK